MVGILLLYQGAGILLLYQGAGILLLYQGAGSHDADYGREIASVVLSPVEAKLPHLFKLNLDKNLI